MATRNPRKDIGPTSEVETAMRTATRRSVRTRVLLASTPRPIATCGPSARTSRERDWAMSARPAARASGAASPSLSRSAFAIEPMSRALSRSNWVGVRSRCM
nr:hypothetical protein [Actinomyces culturomici]